MKKRVYLLTALGVAALLVGGGLMASNMGFKLAYQLTTDTPQNNNSIALPYNQQVGLDTAKDLLDDITVSTGIAPGSVSYYNDFDGFTSYNGVGAGNFNLVAGVGYVVQIPSATVYTIVGSHKPGFVVNLTTTTPQNQNLYAYPYHSTAATALDLLQESGADAIAYYNNFDGFTSYNGVGAGNFALVAGEAYLLQVSAPVAFVPAHY
jgi:hypothetical protein